jgi:hypothetical protein
MSYWTFLGWLFGGTKGKLSPLYFALKIAGIISLILFIFFRVEKESDFIAGCDDYLNLAANATSIESAKQNLSVSIKYLKERGLTSDHTSVLVNTDSEDIGLWFESLTKSLRELQTYTAASSQLDQKNMLFKLHRTILGENVRDRTEELRDPTGISIFPHNMAYAWWGWLSLTAALVGWRYQYKYFYY